MQTRRIHMITNQWLPLVLVFVLLPWVAVAQETATLTDQFVTAARCGDLVQIRRLLDQGVGVDAKNRLGETALTVAAEHRHVGVVRLLLEKGADANAKDYRSWTPLMYAATRGNQQTVQLLLDKGADLNAKLDTW